MRKLGYKATVDSESFERSRQAVIDGRRQWERKVRRSKLVLVFWGVCLLLGIIIGVVAGVGSADFSTGAPTVFGVVVDENGFPVARGVVYAFSDEHGLVASERIGEDGRYEVALPERVKLLRFEAPGFQPELRTVLVCAQAAHRLDVVLERTTSTITGIVVDPVGVPIDDARVVVFSQDHGACVTSAETGSDGRFCVDVAPGLHGISARSDLCVFDPMTVAVVEGEQAEIRLVGMPASVRVSGTVLTKDGVQVGDAKVSIYTLSGRFVCSTKSDSNGCFVTHLSPGVWGIKVWKDGWTHLCSEVLVEQGAVDVNCEVVVHRADATVSGIVLNSDGEPLANVWIEVTDANTGQWATTTQTDESGRFRFETAEGDWALSLIADGYTRTRVEVSAEPLSQAQGGEPMMDSASSHLATEAGNVDDLIVVVMQPSDAGLV